MSPAPRGPSRAFELAVAVHLALFVVGVSWAFGGNASWVRTPISAWGSLGILLTLAALASARLRRAAAPACWSWALPIVALNAVVVLSCLTPDFRRVSFENSTLLMPVRVRWWTPSAAQPGVSLRALWLLDGIYFSCLNLALAVGRRRVLRVLLGVAVANALALAIFGTVQKLVGSTGIFFGAVRSPQDYFFASFVYDNHWGAFVILMLGACIGLVIRYARASRAGGFLHGPALGGGVAALLIAISVPLSGSRACTLLLAVLLALAITRGGSVLRRAVFLSRAGPAASTAGLTVAVCIGAVAVWLVAGSVIEARVSKTREQVAAMWAQGGIGTRGVLYSDTWRMARERLAFGWGMGSFPLVFGFYNTQESKIDRIPVVYHDAHSDWLQSIAEIGLVGTALVGAAVALPLASLRRKRLSPLPFFLFAGCALVAAYAWVEFPFGNVAVVLSWWLCFLSAVQYVRLTDELDRAAHDPQPCTRPSS